MSIRTTLFLALVALFAFVMVAQADKEVSNGDITVHVAGQSGKITFWIPERSDKKYTVSFSSLCESGSPKGFCANNFASQEFTFTGPTDFEFQNISSKLVTFDAQLSNGARLTVDLYVFLESGNYTVAGKTFWTAENTFKWSMTVAGWTFESPDNQLVLSLGLQHPSLQAQWDADNLTISYPDEGLQLQFVDTALYDDVEKPAAVDAKVHGSNTDITVTFSSATNKIWYDPFVTLENNSSAALSSFLVSAVRAVLALF